MPWAVVGGLAQETTLALANVNFDFASLVQDRSTNGVSGPERVSFKATP